MQADVLAREAGDGRRSDWRSYAERGADSFVSDGFSDLFQAGEGVLRGLRLRVRMPFTIWKFFLSRAVPAKKFFVIA